MTSIRSVFLPKIVGASVLGLFLLAFVHVLEYNASEELIQSYNNVEEMQKILLRLKDAESLVKDVQRSHRGYVITGEEDFLQPYENAREELPELLYVLEQDLQYHPLQGEDFNDLRKLVNLKLAYADSAIIEVKEGKRAQAMESIGRGKQIFDKISLLFDNVQKREQVHLTAVREETQYQIKKNRVVVLTAFGVSMLLLLLALWRILRDIANIRQLQAKLEKVNEDLTANNESLVASNEALAENESNLMKAKKELEQREQQLLEAQAISRTGSFEWDTVENKVNYTEEYARIFRIQEEEQYTFERFLARIHPDDRDSIKDIVKTSIKNKTPYQTEYRLNFPDQLLHVYVNAKPVFKEGGAVSIVGTVADISTVKEAQAKIQAQEERFRALLESAPDAMIITDEEGKIVLINLQAEKLFGYAKEEIIGKPAEILVPVRKQGFFRDYQRSYSKHSATQQNGAVQEISGITSDGREFPVEINLSPIRTNDNLLIAAAIRNISERKEAERKLKEANQALEISNRDLQRANAELNTFSYSISHDLRAPLRAISGYSTILKDEFTEGMGEEGARLLEIIRLNASRMGALINDLLEFAKLGKKAINKRSFDMQELVEQVLIGKELKPGSSLVVEEMEPAMGDPALLRQVWENLINNAIKFSATQVQPEISITFSQEQHRQIFCIKDNGIGFDPAYAQDLFQVFRRLHADTSFEGTGAGLAIAKRIVEGHGGQIWASAQVNMGATFCFSLPLED